MILAGEAAEVAFTIGLAVVACVLLICMAYVIGPGGWRDDDDEQEPS